MQKNTIFLVTAIFFALLSLSLDARSKETSDDDVEVLQRAQESNNTILADAVQKINLLQVDLQAMKGALEENRHFFEQESQKNAAILRDFDLRLSGMEERLSLFESQIQEVLSRGSAKPGTAPAGEEADLYRRALAEVNAQNYKASLPLFDQFLKKYPKSSMADNAQYWKGEALYGLKQYPEAILEFQKVIKKFPKSDKVPAAVLKQGYCFFEAKEYVDAKAFLQKVINEYPKSEEALKAQDKIRQIDLLLASPAPTSPARPQ